MIELRQLRLALAASLAVSLLLVSPAYAASPGGAGSSSSFPGAFGQLCQLDITGLISGTQSGGVAVSIEMPYLPTISCLAESDAYQIPLITVPPVVLKTSCFTITIPLVGSWCIPIPDIIGSLTSLLIYIEDSIANALISGFNEIWALMWYWLVYMANVFLSAVNGIVVAIDTVPLGLGGILLNAVLSIGEPWSAFITPWIWFVVIAIIFLLFLAVIFVARLIFKAVRTGAEVGEMAA